MGIITTTIDIWGDYGIDARVEYRHYAGCGPTREHPGDDPETEILSIAVKHGGKWEDCGWLHTLLADDEELRAQCAADWEADQEAARDAAAEARAEYLREEKW